MIQKTVQISYRIVIYCPVKRKVNVNSNNNITGISKWRKSHQRTNIRVRRKKSKRLGFPVLGGMRKSPLTSKNFAHPPPSPGNISPVNSPKAKFYPLLPKVHSPPLLNNNSHVITQSRN